MKLIIRLFLVTVLVFISCEKDSTGPGKKINYLEALKKIPGINISEIETALGFEQSFEIYLEQPVDHQNPDGQKFA